MTWFKRTNSNIKTDGKKNDMPNLWLKCNKCGEIIYKKELAKNKYVCPNCDNHFRINSNEYISIIFDQGTWTELYANVKSVDPLQFKDSKKYIDRYQSAVRKTGLNEAVVSGTGKVNGMEVAASIMDFSFIGGSMGSVVGEKIARLISHALEHKLPVLIVSASGGARMMEASLSLMQMAKTSAKLAQLADAGLPFISLLTDPTTGGTTASFAMLGDINMAEPEALIGFAGQRVIKETIRQDLPEGFQTSEFLLEHGFLDLIVNRKDLKEKLFELFSYFIEEKAAQ
jgi:acetyl-CoA carboxylase carboxyl transferase subunit beta